MKKRSIYLGSILAILCSLLIVTGIFAEAHVQHVYYDYPISPSYEDAIVECDGITLHLYGNITGSGIVTYDGTGRYHFRYSLSYNGITGVDLSDGTVYWARGVNNYAHRGGVNPISSNVQSFKLYGPDPGQIYNVRYSFTTITNANGELVVNIQRNTGSCELNFE